MLLLDAKVFGPTRVQKTRIMLRSTLKQRTCSQWHRDATVTAAMEEQIELRSVLGISWVLLQMFFKQSANIGN